MVFRGMIVITYGYPKLYTAEDLKFLEFGNRRPMVRKYFFCLIEHGRSRFLLFLIPLIMSTAEIKAGNPVNIYFTNLHQILFCWHLIKKLKKIAEIFLFLLSYNLVLAGIKVNKSFPSWQ